MRLDSISFIHFLFNVLLRMMMAKPGNNVFFYFIVAKGHPLLRQYIEPVKRDQTHSGALLKVLPAAQQKESV